MAPQKIDDRTRDSKDQQPQSNRTPGRKLIKEDIATTSVLIRGCTPQTCCRACPTLVS